MSSVKLLYFNTMIRNLNAMLELDPQPVFTEIYIDMLARLLLRRHMLLDR